MPNVKCVAIAGLLIFIDFIKERPHVKVYSGNPKRPDAECKIWLDTMEVARSRGFNQPTLNFIVKILRKYQKELIYEREEIFK